MYSLDAVVSVFGFVFYLFSPHVLYFPLSTFDQTVFAFLSDLNLNNSGHFIHFSLFH